jgi:hypothetical protein
MVKQTALFHTKGYVIEVAEFNQSGTLKIASGQTEDSHVVKILASNTDNIAHQFDLLLTDGINPRLLWQGFTIPPNSSLNLLSEFPLIGLIDTNNNPYFPLTSIYNLLAHVKTNINSNKKLVFTCTSEYF